MDRMPPRPNSGEQEKNPSPQPPPLLGKGEQEKKGSLFSSGSPSLGRGGFFLTLLAFYGLLTMFGQPAQATGAWHLDKMQMVSRTAGWALARTPRGSVLLKTSDGGRDWQNVSPRGIWPLSPARLQFNNELGGEDIDASFLNTRIGWVAMKSFHTQVVSEPDPEGGRHWIHKRLDDPEVVERTFDGGRHWSAAYFPERYGFSTILSFLDTRHGFILTISDMASGSTKKTLYRSNDGGRTWRFVTQAIPDHIDPNGLTFRTASEGWLAAGYHGSDQAPLYRTEDGGRHWRLQTLDTSALYGPGEEDGYSVIYPPVFYGTRRREGVLSVRFQSNKPEREGFALYHTQDAGRTWWFLRRLPPKSGVDGATMQFMDLHTGWALTDTRDDNLKLLLTQNGGQHWRVVYPPRKKKR